MKINRQLILGVCAAFINTSKTRLNNLLGTSYFCDFSLNRENPINTSLLGLGHVLAPRRLVSVSYDYKYAHIDYDNLLDYACVVSIKVLWLLCVIFLNSKKCHSQECALNMSSR